MSTATITAPAALTEPLILAKATLPAAGSAEQAERLASESEKQGEVAAYFRALGFEFVKWDAYANTVRAHGHGIRLAWYYAEHADGVERTLHIMREVNEWGRYEDTTLTYLRRVLNAQAKRVAETAAAGGPVAAAQARLQAALKAEEEAQAELNAKYAYLQTSGIPCKQWHRHGAERERLATRRRNERRKAEQALAELSA